MARVDIRPALLEWARERARLSAEEVCERFAHYPEWLDGSHAPTMRQLEGYAQLTHAPLGYFFLDAPPEEALPISDFRTLKSRAIARPSPNLLDTIHAVQHRQAWMRGYLVEEGEPPIAFVGSHTLAESPDGVTTSLRATLSLQADWARAHASWEDALRALIHRIEEAGVLVMINGIVENNTHRPLDVDEFRGFAISDAYAPVIFVNGADAKSAQMFTLVHELAHLSLGASGVSGMENLLPSDNDIERFCNQVAAEFLVPKALLPSVWMKAQLAADPYKVAAREFKVSSLVVARRLFDLQLITRDEYFRVYAAQTAATARTGSGGNFYSTLRVRLGGRFAAAVYRAAKEGALQYREAYELTGVSGETYDKFAAHVGVT